MVGANVKVNAKVTAFEPDQNLRNRLPKETTRWKARLLQASHGSHTSCSYSKTLSYSITHLLNAQKMEEHLRTHVHKSPALHDLHGKFFSASVPWSSVQPVEQRTCREVPSV